MIAAEELARDFALSIAERWEAKRGDGLLGLDLALIDQTLDCQHTGGDPDPHIAARDRLAAQPAVCTRRTETEER